MIIPEVFPRVDLHEIKDSLARKIQEDAKMEGN
jgi:hypothetical protein